MRKILLFILMLVTGSVVYAQEKTGDTKIVSAVTVKVNNLLHLGKTPLKNYYAPGGEIGVFFKDRVYLGISQYSSLAPKDIWSNNPYSPDWTRMYEYGLHIAWKQLLTDNLYVMAGLRGGYGALHMEYRFNNGEDSDETMSREQLGSLFVNPDLRAGIRLHRFIALEAGASYRLYTGGQTKWGLTSQALNGPGFVLSLVGNIPL